MKNYIRRNWKLSSLAAAAAAAVAAGTALFALNSGPSYPHAWCAPAEAAMNNTSQTDGDYLNALAAAQKSGAPVGALVNDVAALAYYSSEQVASMPAADGLTIITTELADLHRIQRDLVAIDRACGLPASTALHQAD